MMKLEGFDDACLGTCDRFGWDGPLLAYSVALIIESLMADGMSEDEAREFYEYNILGAWVGEGTPVFIDEEQCEFLE